ncbi:hypothetical protein ABIE44_003415 [Marmoricola sp. OAE513]
MHEEAGGIPAQSRYCDTSSEETRSGWSQTLMPVTTH